MTTQDGLITKTGYHVKDNNLIYDMWVRNENHERVHLKVVDTKPYFFVDENPNNKSLPSHFKTSKGAKTITGKNLWKIQTFHPKEVSKYRDKFDKHYEADIIYRNRIRYDNNWKARVRYPDKKRTLKQNEITPIPEDDDDAHHPIKPRVAIIDIENEAKSIEEAKKGESEIYILTIYDSYKDEYLIIFNGIYNSDDYLDILDEHLKNTDLEGLNPDVTVKTVPNERGIFECLKKYLKSKNPDVLTGWNYEDYDHTCLRNRAKNINFNLNLQPYATFDVMTGDDRLTRGTIRNKLDIRGKDILDVNKIDINYANILEDKDKLLAYNLLDVILVKEIDEKKGIIDDHMRLAKLAGTNISRAVNTSWLVDAYILHRVGGKVRLPSKKFVPELEKFEGGFVEDAKSKIYDYIGVLDFKSEYPSIMMEFNISPETFIDNPRPDGDYYTSPNNNKYLKTDGKENKGIVPIILQELIELRDSVKEEMREAKNRGDTNEYEKLYESQRMIKYFMNSFYGVMSSKYFRLASTKTASDITAFARNHIKWIYKQIEKKEHKPIYSDTDSIFFPLESDTYEDRMEEMKELRKIVNSTFDDFVQQYDKKECEFLYIDIDKMYERWLQAGSKKKYAGIYEWKDVDMRNKEFDERLDITGFEWMRIDQAEISKDVQYKVLKKILTEDGLSSAREYLNNLYDRVYAGELDWKIGTHGICRKEIEDYDNSGGYINAFKWMQTEGGYDIGPNDPFLWWYDPKGKAVGVPHDEDEIPFSIDYDHMLERNVEGKIDKLMEQAVEGKFQMSTFLEGKKTDSFMDFVEGDSE